MLNAWDSDPMGATSDFPTNQDELSQSVSSFLYWCEISRFRRLAQRNDHIMNKLNHKIQLVLNLTFLAAKCPVFGFFEEEFKRPWESPVDELCLTYCLQIHISLGASEHISKWLTKRMTQDHQWEGRTSEGGMHFQSRILWIPKAFIKCSGYVNPPKASFLAISILSSYVQEQWTSFCSTDCHLNGSLRF